MNRRIALSLIGAVAAAALLAFDSAATLLAQTLTAQQQLAFDIYKELVEINTVTATGDTGRAADVMAARLRAAGFTGDDVQVFKPAPRKGNLVARLRGTGVRKPILLLAHLDVVEAGDVDDVRAHGKDERVAVTSFREGSEYLYRLVMRLSGEN